MITLQTHMMIIFELLNDFVFSSFDVDGRIVLKTK
jgi:hypothetical protein